MNEFKNSYDIVKEAIESKNVRKVFDLIDGNYVNRGDFEYFLEAEVVFDLIKKYGEGFVVDIARRVKESLHGRNGRRHTIVLSDKQRWCLAFALIKMDAACVDLLRKEDEIEEVEAADKAESTESVEAAEVALEVAEELVEPVNAISADSIVSRALNGEIVVKLELLDASRYISNAKGSIKVNSDIWYSSKTYDYVKGDRVLDIGKKRYNVDELRRRLEVFKGKGDVVIWISSGKIDVLNGELI